MKYPCCRVFLAITYHTICTVLNTRSTFARTYGVYESLAIIYKYYYMNLSIGQPSRLAKQRNDKNDGKGEKNKRVISRDEMPIDSEFGIRLADRVVTA